MGALPFVEVGEDWSRVVTRTMMGVLHAACDYVGAGFGIWGWGADGPGEGW